MSVVVVVERSFAEPVAFEDVEALACRGAWCLEAHAVSYLRTWFSRDRRRMVCFYEAPDAESVRLAQEQAGMPFERAWAARVIRHPHDEPRGDAVVLERALSEPVDEAAIRDAVARGEWCLEQHACRIVWSYLSGDGRRCLCVFAAPDAESVRHAQRRMGMPYEMAWPATLHEPPVAPE
jgi:hypothetical protein